MKWKFIIVSIMAIAVLSLGGIVYYASEKVNGEELRKFMVSSLEKSFPHAKVDVGRVNLKFGKSLNLAVEGLSLVLMEDQSDLFKIGRVSIEVPFGVLLGLEQSITITLEGSRISFVKSEGVSNWFKAMGKTTIKNIDAEPDTTAPTFFANGKINLKFTDTRFHYNLEGKQKGEVLIKYFRVNNLGLESYAAYELKSNISLKFSEQVMDMDLSLVGQFSPREFLQQGLLKTKSILTVNQMNFPNMNVAVPNFKTDIEFEISKAGEMTTRLAGILNDKNRINAVVKTRKRKLSVENIDVIFI